MKSLNHRIKAYVDVARVNDELQLDWHVTFSMVQLTSSVPSQDIRWEERLRNDLFDVEWDEKLQYI